MNLHFQSPAWGHWGMHDFMSMLHWTRSYVTLWPPAALLDTGSLLG